MTASLARTSEYKPNPIDDKTKTRMSYNVALKAAIHVTEKEFILIPIRELNSGEMFDFNYLESSGFLILIPKGLPTAAATYAKLIGYYNGSSDIEIGANLQFETPTNLLIASGDLLINCQTVKDTQVKGQQKGSNNKRPRPDQEDEETPVHNTKTGERSNSFVYNPEGGLHPTRVKTDLATREMDLAVVFRVTEPTRWTSIMGTEYILQCSEYMEYVTEQFKCSDQLRQGGFESCGILDRITCLGFNRDVNLLTKFMKGHIGGDTANHLQLQQFLSQGTIPKTDQPCLYHNQLLIQALRNFELTCTIFYSGKFSGAMDNFINNLEGLIRPFELAPSGFILHAVDSTLSRFFRALRTERNNDKLKDPFHCALFLTDCFADLLSATDTQQKLSEAISRYQLQQLKERILQGRKPTEPPQKPVGAQGNVIRENRICAYHFAGLLKVKSPEGKLFQCKKSTCTYNHLRLASMTHKTIYETIETLPSPLKESCRAAYPSLK